jgi:hypothetical protein
METAKGVEMVGLGSFKDNLKMESEPGVISESKVKKYYLKSICLQVLLVLLMSCVVFSTYFCMEMPSGLEKYIIEVRYYYDIHNCLFNEHR